VLVVALSPHCWQNQAPKYRSEAGKSYTYSDEVTVPFAETIVCRSDGKYLPALVIPACLSTNKVNHTWCNPPWRLPE
jgi:hypothetical protein